MIRPHKASGTVRRFERRNANPAKTKWWNVYRDDCSVVSFEGLIGTGAPVFENGVRVIGAKKKTNTFKSEATAMATIERDCRRKQDSGFIEVGIERSPRRGRLNKALNRIEAWFSRHAPADCPFPFAAGTSEGSLREAERILGARLPESFRKCYLAHDGSNRIDIFQILGLGHWMPLVGSVSVVDRWEGSKRNFEYGDWFEFKSEPKGPIKTDHWNHKWIPFTCDCSGDFLCIDLAPAKGGVRGQVIFWWHEMGAVSVVADSLTDVFCSLADRLDEGDYSFGEFGALEPSSLKEPNFDEMVDLLTHKHMTKRNC